MMGALRRGEDGRLGLGPLLPNLGPAASHRRPRVPARACGTDQPPLVVSPQEVRSTTVAFLLLRIPTLKIKVVSKKEVFEANLKTECDLWHLMVKEMWAGKKLADDHKVRDAAPAHPNPRLPLPTRLS